MTYFTWATSTQTNAQISNANLTVTRINAGPNTYLTGVSNETIATGTDGSFDITINTVNNPTNGKLQVGLTNPSVNLASGRYLGQDLNGIGVSSDGTVQRGGSNVLPISGSGLGTSFSSGDVLTVEWQRSGSPDQVRFSLNHGTPTGWYALTALGDSNPLKAAWNVYYDGDQMTLAAPSAAGSTAMMMGV